jgi:ketosteroid isomerase-like protein
VPVTTEEALTALAHAWDQAMVRNDPQEIGRYMAADWIIVGSDGRTSDRATFLGLIASGELTHDVMESKDIEVRIYGDAAVVLATGTSGGLFRGHAFRESERSSNVFIKEGGQWQCVLTHLSRLGEGSTS